MCLKLSIDQLNKSLNEVKTCFTEESQRIIDIDLTKPRSQACGLWAFCTYNVDPWDILNNFCFFLSMLKSRYLYVKMTKCPLCLGYHKPTNLIFSKYINRILIALSCSRCIRTYYVLYWLINRSWPAEDDFFKLTSSSCHIIGIPTTTCWCSDW